MSQDDPKVLSSSFGSQERRRRGGPLDWNQEIPERGGFPRTFQLNSNFHRSFFSSRKRIEENSFARLLSSPPSFFYFIRPCSNPFQYGRRRSPLPYLSGTPRLNMSTKRGASMLHSSFTGSSNSRRHVSMASRSQKKEDKGEFLARARALRLSREEERRRNLHASIIERWWRGRSIAISFRGKLRRDWDGQMLNLEKLVATFKASGVAFAPPPASVFIFLRQLVAFHRINFAGESQRIKRLASVVITSCKTEDPGLNYICGLSAGVRRCMYL